MSFQSTGARKRRLRRGISARLPVLVAAVLLLSACAGEPATTPAATTPAAKTPAATGTQTPTEQATTDYAPLRIVQTQCFCTVWIAEALGLYEQAGLDVTYIPASQLAAGGAALTQVVVAGQAEITVPSAFPSILLARSGGADIQAVLNGYTSEEGGADAYHTVRFYVLEDSSIRSASDLEGKHIGMWGRGSTGDYALQGYLENNGLSIDDVTVSVIPHTELEAALRSGQIDVAAFTDIRYTHAERAGGVRILFTDLDTGLPFDQLSNAYYFSSEFIREQPETVRAWVTVEREAQQWVLDNPEEAMQIIAEATGLDPTDMIIPNFVPPSCLSEDAANGWAAFLSPNNPDVSPEGGTASVTNEFNDECA